MVLKYEIAKYLIVVNALIISISGISQTTLDKNRFEKTEFENLDFSLDNGVIHIKQDLTRGGAISYISKSGSNRSIVNIADEGRYIQQSYYAGKSLNRQADGQQKNWSPWAWNPIQVGDAYRNRAQILDYSKTDSSTYVKCIPMLWDMNNMAAEAEMEQWTKLNGNVLHVTNKISCFRTDTIYGENIANHQEIPAVYPISALKYLYSYFGLSPFTGDTLDNPTVVKLSSGFWGRFQNETVTENWMAFVDENNWGIGVYAPTTKNYIAGMSGMPDKEANSNSTSYIAPIKTEKFLVNTVYQYEYWLIIGNLTQIRDKVYSLHAKMQAK